MRKQQPRTLTTVAKAQAKPVKHPAQQAGESIHKTIAGVSDTVSTTIATGAAHAFYFMKGLVFGG